MKLKNISNEELESMGYDDIAYIILKEGNKKLKITELFKKICNLLRLSDAEYEEKIGDFFQLISSDKRFTMLDKGFWDLKEKHQTQVIIGTEEDEEEIETTEDDIDINEEEETNIYYDEDTEDDDPDEDDLKDLVIISDDEEDEANLS